MATKIGRFSDLPTGSCLIKTGQRPGAAGYTAPRAYTRPSLYCPNPLRGEFTEISAHPFPRALGFAQLDQPLDSHLRRSRIVGIETELALRDFNRLARRRHPFAIAVELTIDMGQGHLDPKVVRADICRLLKQLRRLVDLTFGKASAAIEVVCLKRVGLKGDRSLKFCDRFVEALAQRQGETERGMCFRQALIQRESFTAVAIILSSGIFWLYTTTRNESQSAMPA